MNKEKFTILIIWGIILVLYCIQEYFITNLVTDSSQLVSLQQQVKVLRDQNMTLNEEVLSKESLTYINDIARKTGYIDPMYIFLK